MHTRSYLAASALLLSVLGCRDEMESPTAPPAASSEATVSATAALAFRQVSSGWLFTCGVTTDDRAYCWGLNNVKAAPLTGLGSNPIQAWLGMELLGA
jgi:hypothetical protein